MKYFLCAFLKRALAAAISVCCLAGAAFPHAQSLKKSGKVAGLVVNLATGEALPGASIEVASTGQTAKSDSDGNFMLELEAGTYELRAFHSNFIESRKEVVVVAGDVIPVDIALTLQGSGEVIEVVAGSGSNEISLLEERKAGATIQDLISRNEISKDTNSDAAGALQRVPGISVNSGKFVFVRGLGDRYSNTVLNDSLMPTPQPDRRVVPLDQVPAGLVQSFKALKSFTPDQPGEFAGGLVKIETLEFPNKSSLKISSSFAGNTETTFQDFLTYPGSRFDFLGFGLGRRELPSAIPIKQIRRGNMFVPGLSPEELQRLGRTFEDVWSPQSSDGLLNQNFGASGSTQFGQIRSGRFDHIRQQFPTTE